MITTPPSVHVLDICYFAFHQNHVHTRLSGYYSGGRLGCVKVCLKRPTQSMSAGDFAATLLPLVTIYLHY